MMKVSLKKLCIVLQMSLVNLFTRASSSFTLSQGGSSSTPTNSSSGNETQSTLNFPMKFREKSSESKNSDESPIMLSPKMSQSESEEEMSSPSILKPQGMRNSTYAAFGKQLSTMPVFSKSSNQKFEQSSKYKLRGSFLSRFAHKSTKYGEISITGENFLKFFMKKYD